MPKLTTSLLRFMRVRRAVVMAAVVVCAVAGVVGAQFWGDTGVLPADDPRAFTANASPYAGDRITEALRHIESAALAGDDLRLAEVSYRQAWEALKPLFDIKDFHQTLAPEVEPNKWEGVSQAITRLVRSMPKSGVESYRRTFAGRSIGELELAIDSREDQALVRLVQRFPFTEGAERGARLLGRRAWEAGNFSLSAWALGKLWDQHATAPLSGDVAGDLALYANACAKMGWMDRVRRLSLGLGPLGERPVTVGVATLTLSEAVKRAMAGASDELFVPSLDEDTSSYTLSRSGLILAELPKQFDKQEWKATLPVPAGPMYRDAFQGLYPIEAPPSLPIVLGNNVLVNAGSEIACFDMYSGSMSWSTAAFSPPADAYHLLESDPNLALTVTTLGSMAFASLENPLSYSVTDPRPQIYGLRPFMPMVRRGLAAVDTVTGRLQWVLGGQYQPKASDADLPLIERQAATTSFHHTVVADGVLYAIGAERENQAEIFLYAIDPQSGRPEWRLSLCQGQLENTMFGSASREPFPGMPLVSGGMLYVVSNLGGTIAVDLNGRSISWIARYDSLPRPYTRERSNFYRKRTFLNSPPVLARDSKQRELLVTAPVDSRFIVAIDALSGQVAWQVPIEQRQANPREMGDPGPAVLIGVHTQTVHVGFRERHIQLDLNTGREIGSREVIVRGDDGRAVSLRLTGRPALLDSAILWPGTDMVSRGNPGSHRVATLPLSEARTTVPPSIAWPREPGNLLVRRGVLLCQHGRDYVAGLDPYRSGDRSNVPTLSAHFDLTAMVAAVRKAMADRPDDPEAMIDFAMLANQLVRTGQVNPDEVERVLRSALEKSSGHPRARRIAEMARRGLFDQSMTRAAAALTAGDRATLMAALVEAEKYVTSESQARDIFLFRESSYASDPQALIDFYTRTIERNATFLLTYGDHRLPASRATRFRRADRYDRLGKHDLAVVDWQELLSWTLADRRGESLRRELITKIHARILKHGPSVYATVEAEAAATYARVTLDREPTADELRGVIRLFPNSQTAVTSALALIKLRDATGSVGLLADDLDREFELRGSDPSTAPVWIELVTTYSRAKFDVSAFVALGRAGRLAPSTPITVDGVATTMGEWVKARRAEIREHRSQNLHTPKLPVSTTPAWVTEFPIENRYIILEQPLGFPDQVYVAGTNSSSSLVALDAKTGAEMWVGPELYNPHGAKLVRYDRALLAIDLLAIRAISPLDGDQLWVVPVGGNRMWTEMSGGLAISLTVDQAPAPKNNKFELVAINCQQGMEAWRVEVDNTNQQLLALGDHSVYAVTTHTDPTNNRSTRHLVRVDLASGEIGAKIELSAPVSSFNPVSISPAGRIAIVTQNGDIEVRDSVSLERVSMITGVVRSVRHVWPDSGLLIIVGPSGDCVAYDVDAGETKWQQPAAPGNIVMNSEVRAGRVVLFTLEQTAPSRPYVTRVLNSTDGSLLKREVIVSSFETQEGVNTSWSMYHEKAVFNGGMAVVFNGYGNYVDAEGVNRNRPITPIIVIVDFADGSIRKIPTWEPSTQHVWPMMVRAHDSGLLFMMVDQMAAYQSDLGAANTGD